MSADDVDFSAVGGLVVSVENFISIFLESLASEVLPNGSYLQV